MEKRLKPWHMGNYRKNLCVLVLWMKVALAMEGLNNLLNYKCQSYPIIKGTHALCNIRASSNHGLVNLFTITVFLAEV